jgi:hypothetical protein
MMRGHQLGPGVDAGSLAPRCGRRARPSTRGRTGSGSCCGHWRGSRRRLAGSRAWARWSISAPCSGSVGARWQAFVSVGWTPKRARWLRWKRACGVGGSVGVGRPKSDAGRTLALPRRAGSRRQFGPLRHTNWLRPAHRRPGDIRPLSPGWSPSSSRRPPMPWLPGSSIRPRGMEAGSTGTGVRRRTRHVGAAARSSGRGGCVLRGVLSATCLESHWLVSRPWSSRRLLASLSSSKGRRADACGVDRYGAAVLRRDGVLAAGAGAGGTTSATSPMRVPQKAEPPPTPEKRDTRLRYARRQRRGGRLS